MSNCALYDSDEDVIFDAKTKKNLCQGCINDLNSGEPRE